MAYMESQYKGRKVRAMSRGPRKPWRATVWMYGRHVSLGNYETRAEALEVERKERARYQAEKDGSFA